MSARRARRSGFQIAVAASLLALLWIGLDGEEALRLLARADPGWLAAAGLALTAQTILSALRWRLTAAQLGQTIPRRHAIGEYYLAQIVNQSLPGGMIGDAGRALRARRQAGLLRAGQAVVLERLAGQLGLLAILLAGALVVIAVPGGAGLPPPVPALIAGTGIVFLGGGLAVLAAPRLPGRIGPAAADLRAATRRGLFARRVLPGQILLSLGTAAANLLAFDFSARATGTILPPAAVAVLVPLILFAMILPVSVSGWGLREGAAAALLPLAGASAAAGLAASIAFGLVFLASSLPGLAILLARRNPKAPESVLSHKPACPERHDL